MVACLPMAAQAQPNRDIYDLQDRCGRRAAEVFAKKYPPFETSEVQHRYSYRNHYSQRLNKCFFLVTNIVWFKPGKGGVGKEVRYLELFDLNENNRYGSYVGTASGKLVCEIRGRSCSSEQEWMELVSPYIDE
jgi:hypothetical protein